MQYALIILKKQWLAPIAIIMCKINTPWEFITAIIIQAATKIIRYLIGCKINT